MNKKFVTADDLERIKLKEEEMVRRRLDLASKKEITKNLQENAKRKHEELK